MLMNMHVTIEIGDSTAEYLKNNSGGLTVAEIIGAVVEFWLAAGGSGGGMDEECCNLKYIVAFIKAQHGRWGD